MFNTDIFSQIFEPRSIEIDDMKSADNQSDLLSTVPWHVQGPLRAGHLVGGKAPQARASQSLLVGWVTGWGFHCGGMCVHGLAWLFRVIAFPGFLSCCPALSTPSRSIVEQLLFHVSMRIQCCFRLYCTQIRQYSVDRGTQHIKYGVCNWVVCWNMLLVIKQSFQKFKTIGVLLLEKQPGSVPFFQITSNL